MDTKKLRQKILDLAIRGKLVPQDPNDEPASVLLERIRAEKERLIKEGKIKRSKKKPSDTPHYENVPFEIPESWEWIRLEDYLLLLSGQDFPPQKYNGDSIGIPYIIGASNIDKEKLFVNRWTDEPSVISMLNDILVVCKGAGVGKIAMNDVGKVHIARQIQAIRDETGILDNQYIKICISSNISEIISNANGLIPGLKRELLLSLMIPIAPITEQHRIVDAVKMMDSLIEGIDTNVCDLLNSISTAKSKILDLAIHGKLVPQDPNDEPAIELLKRINPKFEPCDNAHCTEQLPETWVWTTLGTLFQHNTGKALNKSDKQEGTLKPYLTTSNVYWNCFDFSEVKEMYFKDTELDKCTVSHGDLLVCEGGDIGRAAIWNYDYNICIQNHIHRLRPRGGVNQTFYLYVLMLYKWKNKIQGNGIGLQGLSSGMLDKLEVPLPRLKEQQRIVAKIEELFAVLDEIKESLEV